MQGRSRELLVSSLHLRGNGLGKLTSGIRRYCTAVLLSAIYNSCKTKVKPRRPCTLQGTGSSDRVKPLGDKGCRACASTTNQQSSTHECFVKGCMRRGFVGREANSRGFVRKSSPSLLPRSPAQPPQSLLISFFARPTGHVRTYTHLSFPDVI